MAANPQLVTAKTTITYDGVSQVIPRGTVIDVPNGSALATALSGNIVSMSATQCNEAYAFGNGNVSNLMGGGQQPYNSGQN